MRLKFHPIADSWRLMDADDLASLCADIKANGQRDDIALFEGKVLDGRNRYNACLEVGIAPNFFQWEGDYRSAVAYAKSKNHERRHDNASQRAIAFASLAAFSEVGDNQHQKSGEGLQNCRPSTVADVAEEAGVSVRTMADAKTVVEGGVPELVAAVKEGDISVAAAAKIAKEPKKRQKSKVKQAVAGVKSKSGDKPPKPEKPKGPFAKAEKLLGQMAREIDALAAARGGPSVHSRGCLKWIEELNRKIAEWKRAVR